MQIPTHMLAIEIIDGLLQATQRATPKPTGKQVLIKVSAAGVNRPDVMQRKGLYPPPVGASDIPGLEVSGTVIAIGECVNHLTVGDAVCALVTGGGYAHYCLANEDLCLPIPHKLSFIEAAGTPETFFTVWSNVFDRGHLAANEWLLVHGGSSGIGTTAIQLAKAFGAKVVITAGSDSKCQFCINLGADAAINYRNHDFVAAIKKLTDNHGIDVILDMVGGDYLPRNINCLAYDGRLLQIALQNGIKSDINLLSVMLKRLIITGSTLRARDDDFKIAIAQKLREQVWPLLAVGVVKPIIHATFTLTEAMQAHRLMESSQHIGKIILTT
ncbi:NAD(P)H-quinone oxidoreductase [Crenothrix polyspora]|uniref:NAD(P)H quinone oxidoreductase, PIG3 family n=1 Tax=Crenothrix polyspora TaxID=360316 RepID=A0A1R4HFM8_9GAMM|nr:NAD(P)H-quinone oxidoreductase [Crenothrix polyspora]SJM95033.1 NAD(P)H quinone oxidoreductase, PIG3 family [Crenothrix polyspora]